MFYWGDNMTEQEIFDFYDKLDNLYEYFKNYSLQDIYDTIIISGAFDLSNKEDLNFAENLARKLYYGAQNYNRVNTSWSEIGEALKFVANTMGHKEKSVEYKPESDFNGKAVKEILDELSNEWKGI